MPSVRVRTCLSVVVASLALCLSTSGVAQPGYEPTLVVYLCAPSDGTAREKVISVLSPHARSAMTTRDEVVNRLGEHGPVPDASEFLRVSVARPGPRTILPVVCGNSTMVLVVDRPTDAFRIFVCPPLTFRDRTLGIDLDTGIDEGRDRLFPSTGWVDRTPIPDLGRLQEADWAPLAVAAALGRTESVGKLAGRGEARSRELALRALANAGLSDAVRRVLTSVPKGAIGATTLQTALYEAALAGHTDVVRLLLAAGANPNAAAPQSERALLVAVSFRRLETVKALLPACSKATIGEGLVLAVGQEDQDAMVEVLLAAGGDANYLDESWASLRPGATVLGRAVQSDPPRPTQLRMLLEQEIDDRAMDDALASATYLGKPEIVRLLLDRRGIRATPGAEDVALSRALAEAIAAMPAYATSLSGNVLEATRLLVAAGARVNRTGAAWVLPLAHFAASGDVADVKVVLALGGDPNATDDYGRTALFYAVESPVAATNPGVLETVGVLLEAGADAHFRDPGGITPLSLAEERGLTTFVETMRGQR